MNRVVLAGYIGKQGVELKFTPNNKAVATFSLSVPNFKKKDEKQTYSYFNIVAWGNQAEFLANNQDKFKRLLVDGKLVSRSYDAKDGTKRYVVEVNAENVEVMEWKNDSGQEYQQGFNENYEDMEPVEDGGDVPF